MPLYGTVNPALLGLAREKLAFVPVGGDPSQAQAGGDPTQGDPSQAAAPQAAPQAAPPQQPSSDPTAGVGGGSMGIGDMIQQQVQAALSGMGGGAGGGMGGGMGGGGMMKPKIDQNVVLLQILKMLARISDALGVQIPAQEMVVTPNDLQAMSQQQNGGQQTGGTGPIQPIQPIQPMQAPATGAEKAGGDLRPQGVAVSLQLNGVTDKALAIAAVRRGG